MFMAPMTRSRALPGGVPSDLAIEYYGQRASAGLIITEGTEPAATGIGYARTPSIAPSSLALIEGRTSF
jgi:2,4-dienoyl-CoA reductase-like NADH-dependent reductase (Old Yellow Enzyme family)